MPAALTPQQKRERALGQDTAQVRENVTRETGDGQRRKRGVFNGTQSKLAVNKTIPGYHLHWLNDTATRIQNAVDNGYEFVTPEEVGGTSVNVVERNSDLGSRVRQYVGVSESGDAIYAYLMKIKQEWYDEDQADIQERNDLVDQAIRNGNNTKAGDSPDGFYVPKEGIKYRTK